MMPKLKPTFYLDSCSRLSVFKYSIPKISHMTSYARDLRKLIARTATLVEDRWNSFLGQIDLEKYYPGQNLGEIEFVEGLFGRCFIHAMLILF